MAKSIRSKWKRKCRAIKRVRYGEKELERLKKTIANDPLNKKEVKDLIPDVEEVANVKTPAEVKNNEQTVSMDLDEIKKDFNSKTLRDKNGAFPIWVHPRKIKSSKKKNKKKKNTKKGVKRNNK